MTLLILGLLVFLGVHSIRMFGSGWRQAQIARVGEAKWKGMYSLASAAGLVLIVIGFGETRTDPVDLWNTPFWTRHVTTALMLPALILIVAAYIPGSHIKARVGHPMLAGVALWSLAHLLTNGNLGDRVLFGAFLAWSATDFYDARRRDRLDGRRYSPLGWGRDAAVAGVGTAIWALLVFWAHAFLIGVSPLGF